jgi:hypothetical protein
MITKDRGGARKISRQGRGVIAEATTPRGNLDLPRPRGWTMLRTMTGSNLLRAVILVLGLANIFFAVLVCFDHPVWLWLCVPVLIAWVWWVTDQYFRIVRKEMRDRRG